jgi:hypothetical protein
MLSRTIKHNTQTTWSNSTNGKGGSFGYGILTDKGRSAVSVSNSHKGAYGAVQNIKTKNDPVWHYHSATLQANSEECDNVLKVKKNIIPIPGDANIIGKTASLTNNPHIFACMGALTKKKITLTQGADADEVVSFEIGTT